MLFVDIKGSLPVHAPRDAVPKNSLGFGVLQDDGLHWVSLCVTGVRLGSLGFAGVRWGSLGFAWVSPGVR